MIINNKKIENILHLYSKACSLYRNDNSSLEVFIPNNGNKYYLFIDYSNSYCCFFNKDTIKEETTSCNTGYNLLLLEGYLYNDTFLLTDVLFADKIEMSNYITKYYKLLFPLCNMLLNLSTFKIQLHPIVESDTLLTFFYRSFVYNKSICSIEKISIQNSFIKTKEIINKVSKCTMKISKGDMSDIYIVKDFLNTTKGILYVKGIKESVYLRNLFQSKHCLTLECTFNEYFSKWQVVL